jgi:hypothetical protein
VVDEIRVGHSTRSSTRCDCVCCREALAQRSFLDGTTCDPRLLLQCRAFCSVGPPNPHGDEARAWWATYEPVVVDWLREQVERGVEDLVQLKYGATTLLGVPDMRAMGCGFDEEPRPAYVWDDIDAYEILFDFLAHGGLPTDWDAELITSSLRSFAAYLVRRGFIEPQAGEQLDRDLELWIPRVLAHFDDGPWWTRTGPVAAG